MFAHKEKYTSRNSETIAYVYTMIPIHQRSEDIFHFSKKHLSPTMNVRRLRDRQPNTEQLLLVYSR